MVKFLFSDIEDAFMYISSAGYGMNSAVLCKDTGKIFYHSEFSDIDDMEEAGDLDWDQRIEIPHKVELGLGKDLVFEFVEEYLPDDHERVRKIFRRNGAYSRYKDLLDRRGLLEKWYELENARETGAIREWCEENEIELEDGNAGL
ncbi:MAG: UPF0158 family protein [Desulfatiglandaceae bacterium]